MRKQSEPIRVRGHVRCEVPRPLHGLRPDKYSGRNGVCCDSRYAVCDPDSDPPLSGGGSRPACKPKTCGPDITEALNDVLSRGRGPLRRLGIACARHACASLVTLPRAAISWDINQLGLAEGSGFRGALPARLFDMREVHRSGRRRLPLLRIRQLRPLRRDDAAVS